MIKVLKSLRSLLSRIESCLKCYEKFKTYGDEDRIRFRLWCNEGPWVFPPSEDDEIKGFFGTGDVIFVCERPSVAGGTFPRKQSFSFYKLLKKYGFENAHITDLCKCRGKANNLTEKQIDNCFYYLEEEIRMLNPKLIVAVGDNVYDELVRRLKLPQTTRLEKITHYSYASRFAKVEKLEDDLKKLQKEVI